MKLSNLNVKGIAAAAVLAGTMAFAPVSALATTVTDTIPLVNKTWTAASNSQLNDTETFQFELTYKGATSMGTWTPTSFADFGTKTVNLTSTWLTNAKGGNSASASLTAAELFGDTDFTAPGVYTFHLKEKSGTNPNIVYSQNEYDVVVDVAMPDDYPTHTTPVVRSVFAKNASGDKGTKFENTAHANDSLKVSKTVAGTAANTADEFTYTLNIQGAQGSYDVTKSDGSTVAKVEAGKDYTFTLKHGQSIEVKNLPDGATYTVTEKDTNYNESNTVDGNASADGHVATGKIEKGGSNVAYKNELGFAAATGITMNTIPAVVAGGVVVAGAVTLVISRRRRSSEEF